MTVDQRITQREILRDANERIVGRLVAVRMVLAEHLTNNTCRFDRLGAMGETELVHGKQNAALHRFLAVFNLGQGAAFDHAHRVFEIALFRVEAELNRIAVIRLSRNLRFDIAFVSAIAGGRQCNFFRDCFVGQFNFFCHVSRETRLLIRFEPVCHLRDGGLGFGFETLARCSIPQHQVQRSAKILDQQTFSVDPVFAVLCAGNPGNLRR